jgi:hypothetical protein
LAETILTELERSLEVVADLRPFRQGVEESRHRLVFIFIDLLRVNYDDIESVLDEYKANAFSL